MLHDPKIENHGRIIHGGKTTKSPSNSHVVERAVRIGERQRSRRRGKKEAYSERAAPTSPAPKGEGEAGERPRAPDQSHRHPYRPTEIEREGRKPPQTKHQVHPETPPASPALPRGGKKKKKYQEAKLPKKFPSEGKSAAQKEQSLKGEKTSYAMQVLF